MNLFQAALRRQNDKRPPVWFMRQAGRYHSHYQKLKETYSFMELCKLPKVACEATMGPIRDFDFDAAILFSDLLFPLEVMGTGLRYDPGPKLDRYLTDAAAARALKGGGGLARELEFQAEAMRLVRRELPPSKGLLGFVGGPLTLFCYAVEGSHQGGLLESNRAIRDGRFEIFFEKLRELLAANMALQARAGADVIAMLDTCAGDFEPRTYQEIVVPAIRATIEEYRKLCPDVPVLYYSKGTGPDHWRALQGLPIAGMGIDWRHDIAQVLREWGGEWAIQGNVDPEWLHLAPRDLETRLRKVFESVLKLPAAQRRGWICGLGHGVLQKTPEENVRLFLKIQREMFS